MYLMNSESVAPHTAPTVRKASSINVEEDFEDADITNPIIWSQAGALAFPSLLTMHFIIKIKTRKYS
jgi:hypothetical protein